MDLARMYALTGNRNVALDFVKESELLTHFNPKETGRTFEYADFYSTKAQVHALAKDWDGMKVANDKAIATLNRSDAKNKSEYLSMLTHYHTTMYSITLTLGLGSLTYALKVPGDHLPPWSSTRRTQQNSSSKSMYWNHSLRYLCQRFPHKTGMT